MKIGQDAILAKMLDWYKKNNSQVLRLSLSDFSNSKVGFCIPNSNNARELTVYLDKELTLNLNLNDGLPAVLHNKIDLARYSEKTTFEMAGEISKFLEKL